MEYFAALQLELLDDPKITFSLSPIDSTGTSVLSAILTDESSIVQVLGLNFIMEGPEAFIFEDSDVNVTVIHDMAVRL